MYYLYLMIKASKYLALTSLAISFFSDLPIFKLLCCLILIDLAVEWRRILCSLGQVAGMLVVRRRFRGQPPSVDNYDSAIDYRLPFDGEWTAVNGCYSKEFSHSWDIPTQRYAYDFIILDGEGSSHAGDFRDSRSYYCYGRHILAPADGTVVKVVNNARDSLIFPHGRFWVRARHIAGNYIILQHGEREFSTLAHLQRDSILVQVGDQVKAGQPLAACGNSGNSSEPHLHFQLQTSPSFYTSAGLPLLVKGVKAAPAPNYAHYDRRPCRPPEQLPANRISRGFRVSNAGQVSAI